LRSSPSGGSSKLNVISPNISWRVFAADGALRREPSGGLMGDVKADAKAIFLQALECQAPDELHRFLDAACGGDAALRARAEELLQAHQDAGNFLGGLPPLAATQDEPLAERPGRVIGPYKLMEQIGEGGMGLVFVAEQQHPVRRKVALKVIKPGMDTRAVVARFEAERQALALMDHPNIAK